MCDSDHAPRHALPQSDAHIRFCMWFSCAPRPMLSPGINHVRTIAGVNARLPINAEPTLGKLEAAKSAYGTPKCPSWLRSSNFLPASESLYHFIILSFLISGTNFAKGITVTDYSVFSQPANLTVFVFETPKQAHYLLILCCGVLFNPLAPRTHHTSTRAHPQSISIFFSP